MSYRIIYRTTTRWHALRTETGVFERHVLKREVNATVATGMADVADDRSAVRADRAIVGRSVPRADGRAKVTGAARYTGGVVVPGMVHGVVRTMYAHARIALSVKAALPADEVVAVGTADDIEGIFLTTATSSPTTGSWHAGTFGSRVSPSQSRWRTRSTPPEAPRPRRWPGPRGHWPEAVELPLVPERMGRVFCAAAGEVPDNARVVVQPLHP